MMIRIWRALVLLGMLAVGVAGCQGEPKYVLWTRIGNDADALWGEMSKPQDRDACNASLSVAEHDGPRHWLHLCIREGQKPPGFSAPKPMTAEEEKEMQVRRQERKCGDVARNRYMNGEMNEETSRQYDDALYACKGKK